MAIGPDPFEGEDQLKGSKRMMALALLKQAGQPNPSLGGSIGHALAAGLMGMWEGMDENAKSQVLNDAIKARLGTLGNEGTTEPTKPLAKALAAPEPQMSSGGITENDMAINDVADSLKSQGLTVSPEALRSVVNVESGFNPKATSPGGKYVGATQMGPDTFKEAGGRLGGLTFDQYKDATVPQQLWAYPDYLNHYKVPDKLAAAGIDTASLPPDKQFGVLQAAQFAPNATGWMRDFNAPSTQSPQAGALGNTSVAQMAASRYGQQAAANTPQADANGIPPAAQPAQYQQQPYQVAQAGQPQIPVPTIPPQLLRDPQTQDIIKQWQSYPEGSTQKKVLGQRLYLILQKEAEQQMELRKQLYLQQSGKATPAWADLPENVAATQAAKTKAEELTKLGLGPQIAAQKGAEKKATEYGELSGKAAAGLPQAEGNLELAIKGVEEVRKHPGRDSNLATGYIGGNLPDWAIPANTEAKDFVQRLAQVKGQAFMKAYETLKGGGQITEIEGAKATEAMNRINRATTAKEFDSALDDYTTALRTGLAKMRELAGVQKKDDGGWQDMGNGVRIRERR